MSTKSARLEYGKKKRASTISVYEGKADVTAQGRSVAVKEGYGTRTKEGLPPEPPTPLPAPPDWKDREMFAAIGTSSVAIAWVPKAETASTAIEIAAIDDTEFQRPLRSWTVAGAAVVINGPPIGAYRVRLASVDSRGLVGKPGEPRAMIVMADAVDDGGAKVRGRNGKISVAKGGGLRFIPPRGLSLAASIDGGPSTGERVEVAGEREQTIELAFRTESGVELGRARVSVTAGAPDIVFTDARPGTFRRWATTDVHFRVETKDGAPVSGFQFFAYYDGGAAAPEQLSAGGEKTRGRLKALPNPPGGVSVAVVEVEPGLYVFHHIEVQGAVDREEAVTFYDAQTRLASGARFTVTGKNAPLEEAPAEVSRISPFTQVRAGIEVQRPGGVRPILGIELGADFTLSDPWHLDLSVGTGWVRREAGPEGADVNAHVVPLELRAAIARRSDGFGVYAGVLGGVGFVRAIDVPANGDRDWFQPRIGGLLGLGYDLGLVSLFAEGQWTESGVKRRGDGLGSGPAAFVGVRLSPGR
jgi:hypothetical protein